MGGVLSALSACAGAFACSRGSAAQLRRALLRASAVTDLLARSEFAEAEAALREEAACPEDLALRQGLLRLCDARAAQERALPGSAASWGRCGLPRANPLLTPVGMGKREAGAGGALQSMHRQRSTSSTTAARIRRSHIPPASRSDVWSPVAWAATASQRAGASLFKTEHGPSAWCALESSGISDECSTPLGSGFVGGRTYTGSSQPQSQPRVSWGAVGSQSDGQTNASDDAASDPPSGDSDSEGASPVTTEGDSRARGGFRRGSPGLGASDTYPRVVREWVCFADIGVSQLGAQLAPADYAGVCGVFVGVVEHHAKVHRAALVRVSCGGALARWRCGHAVSARAAAAERAPRFARDAVAQLRVDVGPLRPAFAGITCGSAAVVERLPQGLRPPGTPVSSRAGDRPDSAGAAAGCSGQRHQRVMQFSDGAVEAASRRALWVATLCGVDVVTCRTVAAAARTKWHFRLADCVVPAGRPQAGGAVERYYELGPERPHELSLGLRGADDWGDDGEGLAPFEPPHVSRGDPLWAYHSAAAALYLAGALAAAPPKAWLDPALEPHCTLPAAEALLLLHLAVSPADPAALRMLHLCRSSARQQAHLPEHRRRCLWRCAQLPLEPLRSDRSDSFKAVALLLRIQTQLGTPLPVDAADVVLQYLGPPDGHVPWTTSEPPS